MSREVIHWLSQKVLSQAGYTWELRRAGDLKIGVWRKRRTRKAAPGVSIKRLVLTPGFGDSPISWLMVLGLLRPAVRKAAYDEVVLVDFPGFNGKLAGEKAIPSMDLLLETVWDLYDWLEPHTMIGHSLGGWLTASYAAEAGAGRRPKHRRRHGYEGPARVVLVAAAGAYESVEVRDSLGRIFDEGIRTQGFNALRPHLFAREPFWFRWVAQGFSGFLTEESIHQFASSFKEEHLLQARMHEIRARTWVVWGDRDTLVPTSGLKTWVDGLTGAEGGEAKGVLIKDAGHSPQIEKPLVTAAVLSGILRA